MFWEPMFRMVVLPTIVMLLTFIYPLFGRIIRHFGKKSLKKTKAKIKRIKRDRRTLQELLGQEGLSEDVRDQAEDKLASAAREEVSLRLKTTTTRVLLTANHIFIWTCRLASMVFLMFGWTLVLGMIGASTAVVYAAIMTTECDPVSDGDSGGGTITPSSSNLGFGELTEEVKKWLKDFKDFTFIGDSLGVGVESKLKEYLPDGVYDSKVSRAFENGDSSLSGIETAKSLEGSGKMKGSLVVALGTNQMPTPELMDKLVKEAKSAKRILWVNTASEGGGGGYNAVEHDKIAEVIKNYVKDKSNMAYLDWNRYVKEKSKWADITSDSVHMNDKGYDLYSKFLARGIYDAFHSSSDFKDNKKSSDDKVTEVIKAIKCRPKGSGGSGGSKGGGSRGASGSSLTTVDGVDEPPADAFSAWGWRPEDLPESLKPYILNPENYGMSFGPPGTNWFHTGDPELDGQCVALSISLGNNVWGRAQENVQGNGQDQAYSWASIFGNSVTTTPKRGAIFSDPSQAVGYGHTGLVCTVFKDGSILTVEQNTPLAGWNYRKETFVWHYRVYKAGTYGSMVFAYDDSKEPLLK